MEIVSQGPLRVGSIVWQPRPAAWTLTIACKATMVIEPHESPLAEVQDEPLAADAHWNDDRSRSLRAAGDLAPFKPRADVTLVGHACSAGGRPAASLIARIIIGPIDKSIEVFPDRAWTQDGHLREGPRFMRMPLVYERAGGGPGTINPVGVVAGGAPDRHGRVAVPNLQPPGVHLSAPGQYVEPVGFGPIAAWWPSRLDRLHRHGASWSHRGWAQQPMPVDMDFGYFNAAPADQQIDVIRSNERIVLEDLHAEHPRLVTSLPGVYPRAVLERRAGVSDEIAMHCDTLSIDVDRGLVFLVWRAQIALEHPNQAGRIVVSTEGHKARTVPVPAPGGRKRDTVTAADLGAAMKELALPFREAGMFREAGVSSPDLRALIPDHALPPLVSDSVPPPPIVPSPGAIPPMVPPPGAIPPPGPVPPGPITPPAFLRDGAIARPASVPPPPPAPRAPMLSIGQLAAAEAGVRPSLESIAPMEVGPNAGSVLAASNQAAGGAAAAPPAEEAARAPAAARAPDIGAPEILDLLWFDPAAPDAVRGCLRWQEVLERIQIMPPEVDYDDDPVPTPQSEKDENDVFGILAEADAEGPEALDDLVAEATSPRGRFTPPIAVVAGELAPAFEETEILKATFEAVAPFLATDKRLKETFDGVVEALKTPFVDRSNAAAAALGARLREAFAPTARGLAPGYLEGQIERALVEGRRYQRRPILGEPRVLARLTQADGAPPIPVYLPEALAPKLPLFARFSARLFVEVHLQQDQYEPHPYALRALALGRVSRRAAARPRR